jgi:GT2 family glycosyltransferase
MGAYWFMRKTVFESLSGFDERFFVYFEDADLALRALQAGWSSVHIAGVQAFHKRCGTSDRVRARRLFYSLRSRLLYASKHFGFAARASLLVITLLIEPCTRIIFAIVRGRIEEALEVVNAYRLLYAHSWTKLRKAVTHNAPPIPNPTRDTEAN